MASLNCLRIQDTLEITSSNNGVEFSFQFHLPTHDEKQMEKVSRGFAGIANEISYQFSTEGVYNSLQENRKFSLMKNDDRSGSVSFSSSIDLLYDTMIENYGSLYALRFSNIINTYNTNNSGVKQIKSSMIVGINQSNGLSLVRFFKDVVSLVEVDFDYSIFNSPRAFESVQEGGLGFTVASGKLLMEPYNGPSFVHCELNTVPTSGSSTHRIPQFPGMNPVNEPLFPAGGFTFQSFTPAPSGSSSSVAPTGPSFPSMPSSSSSRSSAPRPATGGFARF